VGLDALLTAFLVFLTVAVFVAYAASRLRVPFTISMVLEGLAVRILRVGRPGVPHTEGAGIRGMSAPEVSEGVDSFGQRVPGLSGGGQTAPRPVWSPQGSGHAGVHGLCDEGLL
jgi:hypothetical protein